MKFSLAISALLFASAASAASVPRAAANKGGNANAGKGGNNAGNNGGNNGGAAAAAASASAAAAASASAAAASSTAAAGNNAGNGAAAGNNGGNNSGGDQSSLTLDQSVIATGFEQNGLNANGSEAGEVASLTSSNNFINFCATTNLPITNGQQIKTGSCNPAPMGVIAAQTNMPASKFVSPTNNDNIAANTPFTITMNIKNLETGNFVNAQSNYYSAPQQVNAQGSIIGHSHFVIEQLDSLTQTTPLDNTKFAFFQGVNTAADGQGNLNVQVTAGLPAGTYRLASINAAANHQPVLVAVAQHGSLDDMVYFTVGGNGGGNNATGATGNAGNTGNAGKGNNGGNNAGAGAAAGSAAATASATAAATDASAAAASTSAAAAAATTSTAATGNGNNGQNAGKGGANAGANAGKGGANAGANAGAAGANAGAKGGANAAQGGANAAQGGANAAKGGKNRRFSGFARAGLSRL